MSRTDDGDTRAGNAAVAFGVPAVAFALLFGFRFVDDAAVSEVRMDLVAVAIAASAATLVGARYAGGTAPVLGKAAAAMLVAADLVIATGAAIGVADIYLGRAPYLVGWFIDVAALGWVGASIAAIRAWRSRRV
ncbi:hypothetical protein DE4585_01145 [Mycobacteroides salmoniphilum]|uniref:Uncharacterized protein n=1 Tax=Mycobacteroides salmoniphilum TaxID=404941 RepID=A0A4R8S4K5_9MYCO|nr:hypothetical protein [Mycobacteroides salmoniphilum]TDZ85826.1 hypothetical protein DE4585_01145 [Mycobacteroides salmoniphilum]